MLIFGLATTLIIVLALVLLSRGVRALLRFDRAAHSSADGLGGNADPRTRAIAGI